MATPRITRPRKSGRPKPKHQQKSSRERIIREKAKALILNYRLNDYTFPQILEAVNETFSPGGDDPIPGFKPIKAQKTMFEWCLEAISEIVPPESKQELQNVQLAQIRTLKAAAYQAALNGSTQHMTIYLQLQEREAKITGMHLTVDGNGGGATELRVFINGVMADL